ncbi:uncharacterized protein FPRO_05625 [Fusarium proliferatum ET1]|uniref:Hsp70 protein n=1 Tax=Fusarium proliferatum (strain ET1) TaxID=1227346 RepID=A0A1L7VET3_FUSPR|nr:uncharacterized protein FPRO_05625 [Fusarium proliferatum ET1]CZR39183.1 uncharacterized protein FPRO_05625 [Fusarium proliferatum ET1]
MRRAGFPDVNDNNTIERLFTTSESENAAEFASSTELKSGQSFTLVDAGGGTVDYITYRVTCEEPVRPEHEVVPADGSLDGSSYINEDFREWLIQKLDDEDNLGEQYGSIIALVETLMSEHFEPRIKRNFDVLTKKPQRIEIKIPFLKEDHNLGFQRKHLVVPETALGRIFLKRLDSIWAHLESLLDEAAAKGIAVETVMLIGGFGSSVSLQKYLRAKLREYATNNNCHVKLMLPDERNRAIIPTVVSSGGVYRACNKVNGPERIAQCSFRILRTEHFMDHPEHQNKRYMWSPHDGRRYIENTIYWFLNKEENIPPVYEYQFDSIHLLDALPGPFICREEFYVSDTATESHYKKSDTKNKVAERAGAIEVDVTFLRDEGLITSEEAPPQEDGNRAGSRHFKIDLKMRIKVIGRDLECTAIYKDQIEKKCLINIASAFRPGVE